MQTKNEKIEQTWNELKGGDTVTLTKYQFAMVFEYGYEYHKKSIKDNPSIENLSFSDLNAFEKELSELVVSCQLPDGKLDKNGIKYDKTLTEVQIEIEDRIKRICI